VRFVAPARESIDPALFTRPPLSQWSQFDALLAGAQWPEIGAINEFVHNAANPQLPKFVAQTPELLRDGLHYEQRIAERGQIATRTRNWHDLLNALIWLRFPNLKGALNARQVGEIGKVGSKQRSRAQCALTHFDEGGAIVLLRAPDLLDVWDAHDWHGLFWRERSAWSDGRIQVLVFGHALLEHALKPAQLLVSKTLAVSVPQNANVEDEAIAAVAAAIRGGDLLNDPQELRPLPLSGIPGWHVDNAVERFYRDAPCFRPLRMGRQYPQAINASR
jgi:Protein of unknown function (DUF3025)